MAQPAAVSSSGGQRETTGRYVVPFVVFFAFLALHNVAPLPVLPDYALRVFVVAAVLALYSRPVIAWRPRHWAATVAFGAAVFLIWIGPDLLFPHYRQCWLFQNSLTGQVQSSLPSSLRADSAVLTLRVLRAVIIVPIVEELFWRGWLMRWLIDTDFRSVAFGTYAPASFWITALLFASEHGPFWDVGLIAGVLYNWWAIRTKSLADCILAHAVTNAALCAWVIATGSWQYWM